MLVFQDPLVGKTNYRNTAVFQSCFSFSLLPLWLYESRFETDLKTAELFNSFFARQCTLTNSSISLPSGFFLKTDTFLFNIAFSREIILKTIQIQIQRKHASECYKYVQQQYVAPFKLFTNDVEKMGFFYWNGKKQKCCYISQKMTNNIWQTTGLSHVFCYVENI